MSGRIVFKIDTKDISRYHLQGNFLLVFSLLRYFTEDEGDYRYKLDYMAELLGISTKQVYNAVQGLKLMKLVSVEKQCDINRHSVRVIKVIV